MPKQIVVTGLGNRIEYATTNGKGLITGKREDVTDECIAAVFQHLKTEFIRKEDVKEYSGYRFGDLGEIRFYPHPEDASAIKEVEADAESHNE